MPIALTCFQGRAGDHNDLGIPGAKSIASHLAQKLGLDAVVIGEPEPALNGPWTVELEAAMPALRRMLDRFDAIYAEGSVSLAATSRCAVSLATLPAVARYHEDAVVVWFDAHGDLNTPDTSSTGYLGGLALSGLAASGNPALATDSRSAKSFWSGSATSIPLKPTSSRRRALRISAPAPTLRKGWPRPSPAGPSISTSTATC